MDIEGVLDRFEQPTHRGTLPAPPARTASATNPRCGDVVAMFAEVAEGRLSRVSFAGSGCTISQAAADVTAELAEGLSVAAARALALDDVLEQLGREAVGARLDCAALALHALQRALAPD